MKSYSKLLFSFLPAFLFAVSVIAAVPVLTPAVPGKKAKQALADVDL
ncbi:hypothetical protein [Mucilaginibacter sp.]|nr:hypothetical protein [Mucilaginibacter sp.]